MIFLYWAPFMLICIVTGPRCTYGNGDTHVTKWVERIHQPQSELGKLLPDDHIWETLLPMLLRMFKEHRPVLLSMVTDIKK